MKRKIIKALVEKTFFIKVRKKLLILFKNILGFPSHILMLITKYILRRFSKIDSKKIILCAFQGEYTCNPKYIAEQIIKEKLPYNLIWVATEESLKKDPHQFPEELHVVERNSYEFFTEAITAKIWIDNSINFFWMNIPKKPEQILIETWHGSLGIKRFGEKDLKDKKWANVAMKSGKATDYCISNSKFENSVYRDNYWKNSEILEYGHPRNDILINIKEDIKTLEKIREKIYTYLELDPSDQLFLYAPTFRDEHKFSPYNIDYNRLLNTLTKRFGGDWVILTRFHFQIRKSKDVKDFNNKVLIDKDGRERKKIINVTSYKDIQELLAVVDIGLTDYSSWIYDFILTGRPGFIYANDLANYNNERGLYYALETTPFPIATNNDELIENILSFDENIYADKLKKFLIKMGCFEDGRASERVVAKIKEIIGE